MLSKKELARLANNAHERTFPAGTVITEQDETGVTFGVIMEGQAAVTVHGRSARTLGPGDYFGEMALIDDTPRSADATAHLACTLYVIQKADLEELMFLHKDLAYELLWTFVRTLSGRLRETNDKIKAFFALSARF